MRVSMSYLYLENCCVLVGVCVCSWAGLVSVLIVMLVVYAIATIFQLYLGSDIIFDFTLLPTRGIFILPHK